MVDNPGTTGDSEGYSNWLMLLSSICYLKTTLVLWQIINFDIPDVAYCWLHFVTDSCHYSNFIIVILTRPLEELKSL